MCILEEYNMCKVDAQILAKLKIQCNLLYLFIIFPVLLYISSNVHTGRTTMVIIVSWIRPGSSDATQKR